MNTNGFSPRLWQMLGQVQAMCQEVASAPLRPETARALHRLYLAKGVAATAAIEGNTLSARDVAQQLDGHLVVPPSKEYLRQETQNIIDGINAIWKQLNAEPRSSLTPDSIKQFNRRLLAGLELEEGIVAGEIPDRAIGVGRVYLGAPRRDCEFLLARLSTWIDELGEGMRQLQSLFKQDTSVIGAVIQATLAHLYLAWIHPFGDGNGRTARLVEFWLLTSAGVPSPVTHLLSNHYNQTRDEYYRQLKRASESGGDVRPFIEYAVQGLMEQMKEQLSSIRDDQLGVAWEFHVYERFASMPRSSANHRQRELVLEMSRQSGAIARSTIRSLNSELSKLYTGKTEKTVTRDLNRLVELELVKKTAAGYRADKALMLGLRPGSAPALDESSADDPGPGG